MSSWFCEVVDDAQMNRVLLTDLISTLMYGLYACVEDAHIDVAHLHHPG